MTSLSTIEISGQDSSTFLQGQLTCDVNALVTNAASFMSVCDRKGRMVANGFIYFQGPHYYLILPASMIPILLAHFKKYAVFSKVSLLEKQNTEIIEKTLLLLAPQLALHFLSPKDFNEAAVHASLAFIEPKTSGLFTPQMLNWQTHGGVSFTKGCFLGQEVVARTEYLGQLKRHLQRITLECPQNHEPGDSLQNQQQETLGIICSQKSAENTALAVLQDKALNENLFCSHLAKAYCH